VKIRGGISVSQIVKDLKKDKILNFFNEKVFLRFIDGKMLAGHYKVFKGEKIWELAKKIRDGKSEMCFITFVPGKTVYQYIEQINADDNFYGIVKNIPPEGYIMPESYKHKCQTSREFVINYAQNSMQKLVDSLVNGYDFEKSHLKSKFDVLIMASIIEKETGILEEMPKISSVFRNRMKIGMKLQTDPTVIYQVSGETGILGRKLIIEDLKSVGTWNTYVVNGLPLTPIASPSREAILAALNPENNDYIFFVASGFGGHVFSKTYKEHLKNVEKYREIVG
jgi:UPF0755 protein